MMGITSIQFSNFVKNCSKNLIAYGANCGVGASDLLRTILGFQTGSLPIIAKGNAGIPRYSEGKIYYSGTPELMADYACLARDCGATIIGGCCGTTPTHLKSMHDALQARPPRKIPTHQTIKNILGNFSSNFDGTGKIQKPSRNFKRRRNR
jgi:5-methyltetrahydrofolate--homocysteine methyltransferase